MKPHRLSIKLTLANADAFNAEAIISEFHKWIQQSLAPGLLIDVADYKHVPDGPAVMLIGHDGDYTFDGAYGPLGLMYTSKHTAPDSIDGVLDWVMQRVLIGASLIEQNTDLRFVFDAVQVQFIDRLRFGDWESAAPSLDGFAEKLGAEEVERVDTDAREPVTAKLILPADASLTDLCSTFEATAPASA